MCYCGEPQKLIFTFPECFPTKLRTGSYTISTHQDLALITIIYSIDLKRNENPLINESALNRVDLLRILKSVTKSSDDASTLEGASSHCPTVNRNDFEYAACVHIHLIFIPKVFTDDLVLIRGSRGNMDHR